MPILCLQQEIKICESKKNKSLFMQKGINVLQETQKYFLIVDGCIFNIAAS